LARELPGAIHSRLVANLPAQQSSYGAGPFARQNSDGDKSGYDTGLAEFMQAAHPGTAELFSNIGPIVKFTNPH
jgi:hypothetical protein